jgi:hypothetical protein
MAYIADSKNTAFGYVLEGGALAFRFSDGIHAMPPAGGPFLLKTQSGCFDARDAQAEYSSEACGLTVRYALPGGLAVTVRTRLAADGIVEREDTVENGSDAPVTVFGYSAVTALTGHFCAYTQANEWTMENQGGWQELLHGVHEIAARGARTCLGSTPYMALREAETQACFAVHALAEGDWRIRAEVNGSLSAAPWLKLTTGPAQDEFACPVAPGETIVLSTTIFQALPGGTPESGVAAFQRYLLADTAHRVQKPIPVEFNSWFYNFDILEEKELLRQLDTAAELGCEAFTIDAGWYGRLGGNWFEQVGDWRERLDGSFYGEMAAFADKVRAKGLVFGVWIEPERCMRNAPAVLEHPDWFLPAESGLVYPDLDREEVAQYTFDTICGVIDRYKAGWVKIDFNHVLGRDLHGSAHMRYLGRLWKMMDDIRAKYPMLTLEGCSSGGMRFEAEMQKHYDVGFMSDTVNPWDVLRIGEGASVRTLPGEVVRWCCLQPGTLMPHHAFPKPQLHVFTPKKATWDDVENVNPDFLLKVCLQGHLSFSGELAGLPGETLSAMKKAVSFIKQHRGLIRSGVFHPLTPFKPMTDRSGWCATYLEGTDSAEKDGCAGILYAYRLESPREEALFRLPQGAVGAGQYTIEDYDTGETFEASDHELTQAGIVVKLPAKNSGALLVVRRRG